MSTAEIPKRFAMNAAVKVSLEDRLADLSPSWPLKALVDRCDKSSQHSLSDEAEPENGRVFGLRHSESDVYFDFCHTYPCNIIRAFRVILGSICDYFLLLFPEYFMGRT